MSFKVLEDFIKDSRGELVHDDILIDDEELPSLELVD
jgi:hypothetical protein